MSLKKTLSTFCQRAAAEGRDTLLEPELYAVLEAGGITTPSHYVVAPDTAIGPQLQSLPGKEVVVKVVSARITHKTEMGGVRIVVNDPTAIEEAITGMVDTVAKRGGQELAASVTQCLVAEKVASEETLGGELFAGLRWAPDMGHVVTVGFGGLDMEELSRRFRPGEATVLYSPDLLTPAEGLAKFRRSFAFRRATGETRARQELVTEERLLELLTFFDRLVKEFSNQPDSGVILQDFELNPLFAAGGRLVAVDAFCRFGPGHYTEDTADLEQIDRLLNPQTAAIIGVSERSVNVGRIILRNLLREGYPTENLRIIRPGSCPIDEVKCVDSLEELPWVADLLVIAVGASQVAGVVREVLETRRANGLVIIAGGMGETEEGKAEEQAIKKMVMSARERGDWAPVIVGPNCLGIRSRRGRYDTLFIPDSKLARPAGNMRNTALICQSGAFLITRMDGLGFLDPAYAISTGNQMDLTIADFTELLMDDPMVDVLALYIEGFDTLEGRRLARLVRIAAREKGKDVLVYKAGRTSEGLTATSSHTASISSDYKACTEVLRDAGAFIANSFRELKAMLAVAGLLHKRDFGGLRLGAISNAGFETVGMADNVWEMNHFLLADLSPETRRAIRQVLEDTKIESLVSIRNPLDLTPMAPDKVYAACLDALLADPNIDAVIVGIVPMTTAMMTLPPGADPTGWDSLDNPLALHNLLPEVIEKHNKPVVTAVDGGRLYDALEDSLHLKGIPCFRTADFAMRTFQRYLGYRFRNNLT